MVAPTLERDDSQYYIDKPDHRTRGIRDWNWRAPGIWLGVLAFLALISLMTAHPLISLAFFLAAGLGCTAPPRGFTYQYPRLWVQDIQRKWRGEHAQDKPPASAVDCQVDDFFGRLGVVHDNTRNMDTAHIDLGPFENAQGDVPDFAMDLRQCAAALKRAVASTLFHIHYGFIIGSYPASPDEWAERTYERFQHKDFQTALGALTDVHLDLTFDGWMELINADPDAGPDIRMSDMATMANLEMVWDDDAQTGSMPVRTLFLTVRRPKLWKNFRDHPEDFTFEDFTDSGLYRTLTAVIEGLQQAGYRKARLLGPEEMRQRAVFRAHNVLRDWESRELGIEPGYQGTAWPNESPAPTKEWLRTDKCYHSLSTVKKFGGFKRMPPNGMVELFLNWPEHTIVSTFVGTVSARRERWFARNKRDFFASLFRHQGRTEEEEDIDKAEMHSEAINRQYRSGTKPIRQNTTILVRASSVDVLKDKNREGDTRKRELDLRVRPNNGPATLEREFWSATLGIMP